MEQVLLKAYVNGDLCSEECPFLIERVEGIPDHVRKSYPKAREYSCCIFGALGSPQEGPGFKLQRPMRSDRCKKASSEVAK